MGRLEGKHAIITGGSRGVGRGVARAYAKEGARVTIVSRKEANVKATAAELRALTQSIGLACDVSSRSQVEAVITQSVRELGPVDILVNAAQSFGTAVHPTASPVPHPLET